LGHGTTGIQTEDDLKVPRGLGAEKMRTVMMALRTAGVVTSKETTQFRVHATKAATAA
jgi:hypothetical protein